MAFPSLNALFGQKPTPEKPVEETPGAGMDDESLLALWNDTIKKECLADRHIFERQWMRNIYYILGRQWIEYYGRSGGWRDKRIAQWIPRPVTNKCKETLQTIRSMFTSIKLGVIVRPNGTDPKNVSAAHTADELAPVLYEAHKMNRVLTEFDFWLIACGNAFIHSFVDYDLKNGSITITAEQCMQCQGVFPSNELTGGQPKCPECGGTEFMQATNPETGEPLQETMPQGRPSSIALSPLELAFPNTYGNFDDLPYVVRLRWRTKSYYKNHPVLMEYVDKISWQKTADNPSLQLYRSLATHNDLGISTSYNDSISTLSSEDGIPEYEVWYKPCAAYRKGLVFRIAGDSNPIVIKLPEEGLPGPLPYTDIDGNPIFTFAHAPYEQVGGRVLGSGPIDQIIQKQDQLNQLDSMILLIIQRMANPVWLEPKGAEVERLTGMPGLVVKWNPLTVSGNAKPERIPGEGPHPSLFQIREQYLRDIEELVGTFDIMKGAKPAGVEAFSAMQLLVERSQARFSTVFQARGDAFRQQAGFALELEREFGPDERTKAILSPARTWTFKNFKRAQLSGSFSVIIEDGSSAPKTNLGMRAALEHANQLGMVNMQDPDQQYEGLKLMGLVRMVPSLDIHVQAALQKQQAFEEWAASQDMMAESFQMMEGQQMEFQQQAMANPDAMAMGTMQPPSPMDVTPLKWRRWYNPIIHRQEFMKWANSDTMRELLAEKPELEKLLEAHLLEIETAIGEAAMMAGTMAGQPAGPPGGAGAGMANSNRESTQGNEPRGNGEGAQKAGPA